VWRGTKAFWTDRRPHKLTCRARLAHAVCPVFANHQLLGILQTSPFRTHAWQHYVRDLRRDDPEAAGLATRIARDLPSLTRQQTRALTEFLQFSADTLDVSPPDADLPVAPYTHRRAVRMALDRLRADTLEDVCLEYLADETAVSPSRLSRWIHQLTGLTFREHLTRARVQLARRLLAATTLPVADIAARCGYASPSAFTNAFHKRTGQTAAEFRESRP
jgi:transcriptional regulator GlxA family with amidase domain